MKNTLLIYCLLVGFLALAACDKSGKTSQPATEQASAAQEKPAVKQEALLTLNATVTAINHETREVTLQDIDGESFTFIAGDEVRNLDQVEVGDKLSVEYLQTIKIQVLPPDQAQVGGQEVVTGGRAAPGEKPAGAVVSEKTLVTEIEAINKERQTVILKGPQGIKQTVKVRNPENLEKIAIGDKVLITYTEAMAVKVTEK